MPSLSGKPDPIQSSLKIEPDKLFSDGAATAKVILELVDLHGNRVEDEKNVRFLISQNRGVKVGAVTNNNGIYTATIIGTGDFFGTVDVTVNIDNRDLSGLSAELILYAQPIVKEVEITGTRRIGEALNLTYNFDARGTQGDDSSYLWQYLDNHSRWQNANVSGSRNQGFTLVGPHAGNMIKVWVLPKSKIPPVISARVASSPVMLFDVPEIQDKKVTIKGSGQVGQKLQAEYGFVANGTGADDSAVKWQWRNSSGEWKPFTSNSKFDGNVYTPGSDDAGDVVRACVTPKGKEQSIKGGEVCVAGSDLMTIYSYDFSITPSSKAITEGGQFLFSVRAAPINGQASIGVVSGIDWRIADTSIASIDNNGKVKGKKAGDTKIHASGNYKGIKFDVTATLSVKGNHLSPVYGKPSVGDSEKKYIIQPPSYSLKMRTGYVVDAIGTSEDLTGGSGGNNVTIDNLANLISIEVTTGRYNHAPNAVTISTIKFNYKGGRSESAGLSRDMDKGSLRTEVYTIPSGYILQGFIVYAAQYSHAIQFVSMPQE